MKARAELALRIVGVLVWLAVGSPVWTQPHGVRAAWALLYVTFGVGLFRGTASRLTRAQRLAWLTLESACALVLAVLGMPHFEGALLALVAAQAAWFVAPLPSLLIGCAQAIPLLVIVLPTHGTLGALKATGEYLAFSMFATLIGYLRTQEERARLELARERAVLLGTQSLLEDGARLHERARLAREVHDAMGHGLTAASVSLQVAARTGDTRAIELAQAAVQQTLAEVRALVSDARERRTVDLRAALRALAVGIPHPRVAIEMPDDLAVPDERHAHALFRLVQEGITNAVKHGHATLVRVIVQKTDGNLEACVQDDGTGGDDATFGNGLDGLRARFAEIGGAIEVKTTQGRGFELRGWVPV